MIPRDLDNLFTRENPPPAAARLKQIEAGLIGDLKPVRPLASQGFYLAAFTGIFLAVCIVGCVLVGQAGWRALSGFQRIAVFAPLATSIALLLVSMVRQMAPGAKYIRVIGIFSVAAFLILLVTMPMIFQRVPEIAFVHNGLACFKTGMAFSIPAAILFTPLLLRGAGLSPALTGATAGGVAGLVGLAVLEIHCPNLNVNHIVVWHVSVTLVCVVGGLIFSGVTFQRWTSNNQASGG